MKIEKAEDVELLLKTNKQSESGIFSNERLLMIKAGVISYFSEVSKKFTGNAQFLESSGQFPKYTIKANEIHHIELKGGTLSMLFKKSKLISRNQFQDLVKKVQYQPDRTSQISVKQEGNSDYVKWTFQSENLDLMKEFVRLTNLFRSNNPKFHPNLSAVLSTFRGQKQKQGRQMSMKPAVSDKMLSSDINKKRMSEIPNGVGGSGGRDSFLESLGILDKKEQKQTQQKKSISIPIPTPQDEATARAQLAKSIERRENQRLNRRKSHLTTVNHPAMGIIQQKQNQDKLSEMSKNLKDGLVQPKLEIKPSIQSVHENIIAQKKQQSNLKIEEKIQQPISKIEEQPSQEFLQPNFNVSASQIEQIVIDLDKPSTQQNIIILNEIPEAKQSPFIKKQASDINQTKAEQAVKHNRSEFSQLSNSFSNEWRSAEDQQKQEKMKKMRHFFKATSQLDHFDPQQICQKLQISFEQLESLMKIHSKQEQSAWGFIQNNLAYYLAKKKINENGEKKLGLKIGDQIIKQYYQLGDFKKEQNFQFLKISLQNDVSFIRPETQSQQDFDALNWMQQQMEDSVPKQFSSKITNKSHFKIYIKPLQFKRQKIIHMKGNWIVNQKGHLQEFLAYLRLQKVVKEISLIISNDLEITCGDAIYLRYKEYEGIAKQWRVGYPCFPIRSIKSLEYITKSKQMRKFQFDFPQFSVVTEVIKEGYKYRLHLDRIDIDKDDAHQRPLLTELKKLIFPFDNELDLFYNSLEYTQIEDFCLEEIQKIMDQKKNIGRQDLYEIIQKMENKISIDTLCKILGCRIDKKGNLYFHHTILRLGGRQFGEEISLIKRSKKKGNLELGKQLSKRLMGKLHYYQYVTPIGHFIEIYLQIIDFMIVNEGQLHRAVQILLKVLSHLGDCQAQQYPIYLSLMKTYLKLNDMENFAKCLENCRLMISQMFKQYSPLLDYPLQRIIIMILLKEDTNRALTYSIKILKQIKENQIFPENIKERYISKIQWDKSNILLELQRGLEAYNQCIATLKDIQSKNAYYPDYWIDGVLCLSRCWLSINEVNSVNGAKLQKRIAKAIQLAFSRQSLEMVFVLFQTGLKVLNRCQQLDLPKILDTQHAFQLAQIEFNQTQAEIFYILTTKK